jgi:hypothetical protein
MMRKQMERMVSMLMGTAVLLFGAMAATPAVAGDCTGGILLIATNTVLGEDWFTSSGDCFILQPGKSLDLNGHRITCTATTSCDNAVRGNGGASTVRDGEIRGPFAFGVTAVNLAKALDVEGSGSAIAFTSKVQQNVLTNCGSSCIANIAPANTIDNNFIDGASTGIFLLGVTSGTLPVVERNFVRNVGNGVWLGSGNIRLLKNIVANATTPVLGFLGPGSIVQDNICDNEDVCPLPEPPFTLP